MDTSLGSLQKLALAKLIKETDFKALSKTLDPGKYAVNFTVEVEGVLVKGEDTCRKRTADIKWRAVCAFILAELAELNPLEAGRVAGKLEEIVGHAARAGEDELKELESRVGVSAMIARLDVEVAKLPPTPAMGALRADLSVRAVAALEGESGIPALQGVA